MDAKMNLIAQLGYQYFADRKHYTRAELEGWLESVGGKAQWICLKSSCSTAIPEIVLLFCEENGIKPIIQFNLAEWSLASPQEFAALLEYYKKNGVSFIQLDDYFNQRSTWQALQINNDLLPQLSSTVIDFHQLTVAYGFYHVLPKLMPGGDYWDLVVLKYLLQQLHLAEVDCGNLVLSFTAWFNGHPLLWGKGGKRKWTEPQPYQEKFSGEDHRGFMGFEWYQEVAEEELGRQLPILILDTGRDELESASKGYRKRIEQLISFLGNENNNKFFEQVLGVCLAYHDSVFTKDVAEYLKDNIELTIPEGSIKEEKTSPEPGWTSPMKLLAKRTNEKCISHYLLLPEYDWGVSPWHLEVALPFIRKYRPTIGYSLDEAKNSTFVTLVMDDDVFDDCDIEGLTKAGCKVAVIYGDGTEIATKLAVE